MKRYLESQVRRDLLRKMVFVGGPRQVGKTTLAKSLLGRSTSGLMNWDVPAQRDLILRHRFPKSRLWVFDEIHKYRKWRNYLKGVFDARTARQQILVTGSARLDYYRFGGDSLQGRYHFLRLHPLSAAELGIASAKELAGLLKLGGFPEPFLGGSESEARRWSNEYRTRLVREDLVSLEQVQDIGSIELLMTRLPALVGSPLSINGIAEQIQISHKTVAKWLSILERMYAIFLLMPFGSPRIKAVKKARKHYHLDWSLVPDMSLRFENLVASHLLKWVQYREDTEGYRTELRYFRDIEGREVDFVVTEDAAPTLLVECKSSDREISPSLRYLKARFPGAQAWQISVGGRMDYVSPEAIRVAPALSLLSTLV
ncbi:MAG: ATP-binding protein [Betaproteobacteria bacterium]|nr:ATP-binding protein [Betaproteobacteria bacterium]